MSRSTAALARERRNRLLRHYVEAGPACRAAGAAWYPNALRMATELAGSIAPRRIAMAAGVIAALSPRAQWAVNLAWAGRVIDAADSGDACPHVGLPDGRAKAWHIAASDLDPLDVLRGPKVRAFYQAILGNQSAAVIDIWAARAVLPDGEGEARWLSSELRYHQLAQNYRDAAAEIGLDVPTFQATVWLHVRGDKPADPSTFTVRDHR